MEGRRLSTSIPLTALSSRSFCRGAKFDIVVGVTIDTEDDQHSGKLYAFNFRV